jgi:Protein of unknown function (DUF1479)
MNESLMKPWMHDVPKAIVQSKADLRQRVPDLQGRFAWLDAYVREQVQAVRDEQASGGAVPELQYADIVAGRVSDAQKDRIRRRGCVVLRGVFDPKEVLGWNDAIAAYIEKLDYEELSKSKAGLDKYFSALGSSKPQIYSLYWTPAQIQARQHPSMARAKVFLNNLWDSRGINGQMEFDPNRECAYADRIRRRPPGAVGLGLSPHADGGSVERWCDPSFHEVYREVYFGDVSAYNPFSARGRTHTNEIPSPAVASVFRSFQGWTALSSQGPGDGTLRVVPIAKGMAWMLLRALLDDVPANDLCGAQPGRALGANAQWHQTLLGAEVSIPTVHPGDTVWWHSDVIHSVEEQHKGQGYSSVTYIGAAPWCEKNARFLQRQAAAFEQGRSCPDFASEDYELNFSGRATLADLSELGKKQMGLAPW